MHKDKILLFRMGDFFEMFFDDAVKAAPVLGIALTSRNKKSQDETPMCGVPHHSIGGQINKLLAAGLKVAICDQIEDPKFAKGLVKRAVTRVLTPGMVYDAETLEASKPHYVAAVDAKSLAVVDVTTGEALFWKDLEADEAPSLVNSLSIAEIVLPEFDPKSPEASKQALFEKKLPGFPVLLSRHSGLEKDEILLSESPDLEVAQRLLSYIRSLEGDARLKFLRPFSERRIHQRLEVSGTTLRHLEIFETSKREREGSLLAAVDRTKTSLGARLLRSRLAFPYCDEESIKKSWNQIDAWVSRPRELKMIRERLAAVGDLERRLTRIGPSTCNSRDLRSLQESLSGGLDVLEILESITPKIEVLQDMIGALSSLDRESLKALAFKLDRTLLEELPLSTRQGGMIREGVSPDLDEALKYATHGQELLQEFEAREKAASDITSLKVRYNNVFGFYIEVTNTHKDKVPKHYLRKQTLTNAERYTTDELVELERKILSAQTRRFELESEIYENLRSESLKLTRPILSLAQVLAGLDLAASWATLAQERAYVRPEISSDQEMSLMGSRHPVVERKSGVSFTANDIRLERGGCLLLTGPNMAGKSTLMRQVALSVILAQSGGFVPAKSAKLPLFDRVFTRIGANDSLSEGLSTFMVEMKEAAEIVKGLTKNSLVILDELGRGTSTFDGLSLAQALLEYLLAQKGGYFLFATHYHELTKLERLYPQVHNAHMAVAEKGDDLRFLYSLKSGPALKSYGIYVAQLAGLPTTMTKRAAEVLKGLEQSETGSRQMSLLEMALPEIEEEGPTEKSVLPNPRLDLLKRIESEIEALPLDELTPLQALVRLQKWQSTLKESEH